MKIVVNRCFGGFGLSEAAYEELGIHWDGYSSIFDDAGSRADPRLVGVVEKLGNKANAQHARLEVVEIPDDVDWIISDYDGNETIREKHRSW